MNLKISSLLVALSFCAINTNCSAADSKYMINYDDPSFSIINEIEKLAGKEYEEANTLSDICDIFIAKLNQLDYKCDGSPLFKYHPILKLFQPFEKRINRNRNNIVFPSMFLAFIDPTSAVIFLGSSIFSSILSRNMCGCTDDKIYSEFINEYNKFANAISNFMNTHDIDNITADQNLQNKWNSSSKYQNTFGVVTKEFLKILSSKNMITSVQNIEQYTQLKPVFEKYLLKFIDQIEEINENDIYNDYARKIREKYDMFVKEMYKQINTLNGNNFTDEELQKAWGLVLLQHINKLNEKLDNFKKAYSENDYTLKNFYDIFPIVDLTAIKQYAEKNL